MGKIGDLWVKLGLKKEEFDKGMEDVGKKAEKTEGIFGKMKGATLAVWAAIGGAVMKVGKDMVNATNAMQDTWEMFTSKAGAAWDSFVRALVNNSSWSQFWDDLTANLNAVEQLTEALDADTEILNSIKIQKARMADELAELEIAMRDQTKSFQERAAAAQRYLALVDPIYEKEIERAKKLKDAQFEAFIAGSRWSKGTGYNEANQRIWEEMLIAYGDLTKIPELGNKTFAEALSPGGFNPAKESITDFIKRSNAELQAVYEYAAERFKLGDAERAKQWVTAFYEHYENGRNGEQVQQLIDSILAGYSAESARNKETKRVQSVYNSALAGMQKEAEEEAKIFSDAVEHVRQELERGFDDIINEQIEIEIEPIEFDFSSNDEYLNQLVENWRKKMEEMAAMGEWFNDTVTQSISGGVQAMTDAIMGIDGADATAVLGALITPFADMAIQLGEMAIATGVGIEAIKTSLDTLQGPAAIAAGVALVALGSAMKAGVSKLAQGGGGTTASTYSGSGSTGGMQTYENEMTIYVEGKISGSDIVLAGQRTLNAWKR